VSAVPQVEQKVRRAPGRDVNEAACPRVQANAPAGKVDQVTNAAALDLRQCRQWQWAEFFGSPVTV
jgi:hypothetical protein